MLQANINQLLARTGNRRLALTLSAELTPPSDEHELLLAFHFGSPEAGLDHPAIVQTGLQVLGHEQLIEGWWYRGEVQHSTAGTLRTVSCDDFAVVIQQLPDTTRDRFREHTREAYRKLLAAIEDVGCGDIVKIWNYFDDINAGEGDEEKYRQFSVGRAIAFDEAAVLDHAVPTGTAIGSFAAQRFTIVALCTSQRFQSVENPRQVSAFDYPRQYGPRSPKFSRGGCVATDDLQLRIVSGTAAIVGHESAHPYDIEQQLAETVRNLDHLVKAISSLETGSMHTSFPSESVLRVYLKDPAHAEYVARELREQLKGADAQVAILHACICRRELVVEVDGASVRSIGSR